MIDRCHPTLSRRARRLAGYTLSLCLILLAVPVRAAVVFSDSFNYANGNLTTVGAAKWTSLGGTADLIVSNGAALLRPDRAQDVQSTTFAVANPTTAAFYAAFDLTVEAVPGGSGNYFAAFNEPPVSGQPSYSARLHIRPVTGSTSTYNLGLTTSGAADISWANATYSLNAPLRLVLGYRPEAPNGDRYATMWVNPTSEAGFLARVLNANNDEVDRFALRQPGPTTTNSYGTVRIDNLLIANDFNDVVAVPEPAGLLLVAATALALLQRRRVRSSR
jgi:hypothetical protein